MSELGRILQKLYGARGNLMEMGYGWKGEQ